MGILLKNGIVFDGLSCLLQQLDLLIEGDRIAQIGENIPTEDHEVIRVDGQFVAPGLIDMHVHLREPGFEEKETIATGTASAAHGGFTTVACMPNTRPVLDNAQWVRRVLATAAAQGSARVLPIAAITLGLAGEQLTNIAELHAAGAVGFSDDGRGVQNAGVMKEAMKRAAEVRLPIIIHSEEESLSGKGYMHEGAVSERLGLLGIPAEAESVMIARDAILAQTTGAHLHVCHVSAASSVDVIRWAKSIGVRITAEAAPHHLLLTDENVLPEDANTKVNPPLRSEADRFACVNGFLDGTLDIVATDHAPHTVAEKAQPFAMAPFGMVGLEIAFPLMYTSFVQSGIMSLPGLLMRMSSLPAQLFGLLGGTIERGRAADIAVFDLALERSVDPKTFASKGRNTPFTGKKLTGWPTLSMVGGTVVYNRSVEGR